MILPTFICQNPRLVLVRGSAKARSGGKVVLVSLKIVVRKSGEIWESRTSNIGMIGKHLRMFHLFELRRWNWLCEARNLGKR